MSVSASRHRAALRAALAPIALDGHRRQPPARRPRRRARGPPLSAYASSAPRFKGLSRVARHRLVYDALHSLMPRGHPRPGDRRPRPDEPGAPGAARA